MPVRNLNQQRHLPFQLDLIDQIRKFFPKLFCQKHDSYGWITNCRLKCLIQFFSLMHDNSVHARKAVQRTHRADDVDRMLAIDLTRDANWVASDVTALAAGQDERWTALIESAARLAALVPQFDETDAKRLRDLGLAELEIVDHVASTAFFGWANRLMLTLGEPYWPTAEATS